MRLQAFFPYRLAVLADAVSRSLAQVYGARFDLSRDAWRILAALAEAGDMKTTRVIEHATLDKMQVSRAVAQLERDGLVARTLDPEDRRGHVLHLLPPGRVLYRRIVPLVRAREEFLLAGLDAAERAALDAALDKVLQRARQLGQAG